MAAYGSASETGYGQGSETSHAPGAGHSNPVTDYSLAVVEHNHPVAEVYKPKMQAMMGHMVKTMMTKVVSTVMESNSARLAMIVSGIVFTQTSILNYVYFLDSVRRLLGAG